LQAIYHAGQPPRPAAPQVPARTQQYYASCCLFYKHTPLVLLAAGWLLILHAVLDLCKPSKALLYIITIIIIIFIIFIIITQDYTADKAIGPGEL
jgi:hypothetical protein